MVNGFTRFAAALRFAPHGAVAEYSARNKAIVPALLAVALAIVVLLLGDRFGYGTAWSLTAAGLLLVVLFLHVMSNPDRAVAVLTLSLPFVAVGVIEIGWSVRPTQIIMLLIVTGWLVAARPRLSALPLWRPLTVYVASLVFALLWAYLHPVTAAAHDAALAARASALRPLVQLLVVALQATILIAVLLTVDSAARIGRALKLLLGVTSAVCIYGIYQTAATAFGWPLADITQAFNVTDSAVTRYGETRFYRGITAAFAPRATFAESLHFAGYLAGLWPIVFAGFLARRRLPETWRRWRWGSLAILVSLTLFLTFSRSGWLAAVLGTAWVLLFLRDRRALHAAAVAVVMLATGIVALSYLPIFNSDLSAWELITGRMSVEWMLKDPRIEYAAILWQTFAAQPVFGVGLGNFGAAGAAALGTGSLLSAHGVWSAHLAEGGLVGLAALLVLVGAAARYIARGLRRSRNSRWFVPLVGLSGGLVAMSFQYLTYGDRFGAHYWFLLGIAVVTARLVMTEATEGIPDASS